MDHSGIGLDWSPRTTDTYLAAWGLCDWLGLNLLSYAGPEGMCTRPNGTVSVTRFYNIMVMELVHRLEAEAGS